MPAFTELESAVLKAICDHLEDFGDHLRVVLATAQVAERDNTGHGFYTRFSVDQKPPLPALSGRLLDGPVAHMDDMGEDMQMGFILWFEDGYPDCLEGFQYGDSKGETVDLKLRDLRELTFASLAW